MSRELRYYQELGIYPRAIIYQDNNYGLNQLMEINQAPLLNLGPYQGFDKLDADQEKSYASSEGLLSSLNKNLHEATAPNLALEHDYEAPFDAQAISALNQPAQIKKSKKSFVRDQLPVLGYGGASVMHLLAGLSKLGKFFLPKSIAEFIDKYSLTLSKAVNVANYTYKGIEALAGKRAWEGIARLAYSAIVPFVPLESVFSASGISSGLTMMEQAQRHKLKHLAPAQTLSEDLKRNFSAFKEMCLESIQGLPFISKNPKVFVSPSKEQGHSMFFCAWGNFVGAILGFFAGNNHSSPIGKLASFFRNAGGVGCDWAKFIHPDINNKISAILYLGVSGFDFAKSFTNDASANIMSHFSLALNNFANYYYVNTTKTTTDGEFKDYEVQQEFKAQPQFTPLNMPRLQFS
jgi:hypothetical protein